MKFIRKGGRVIPIKDNRLSGATKGAGKGFKTGAKIGAAVGSVGVGLGYAASHGLNKFFKSEGVHDIAIKMHAPTAAKFVIKKSAKWAIAGAAVGAGIGALKSGRKNGKSKS